MPAPKPPNDLRHTLPELPYRLRWRSGDSHAGSHRARLVGGGEDFRGLVPLGEGRDARRIDLRASATDPWGRAFVREFRQRSRVPVMLLADLSASMRFAGRADRLGLVGELARVLARSAFRRGDPFGFIGCDHQVRRDLMLPPVVSRAAIDAWLARVQPGFSRPADGAPGPGVTPGPDAQGLLEAARWMPRQRSLVFLLSDLYLPQALLEQSLRQLAPHEVVVVLLADSAEFQPPARWGLVRLADLESGRERLLLLRPGLAARLAARQRERIDAARRQVQRLGANLLFIEDRLDVAALGRQMVERGLA